jgi:hypothetical protein
MTIQETIQNFVNERNLNQIGSVGLDDKGLPNFFHLNYYDTYSLTALTRKHVLYLSDEIMEIVRPHKEKIFFNIGYDPKFDSFELKKIYYRATMREALSVPKDHIKKRKRTSPMAIRCERPLMDIKTALQTQRVGTSIESKTGKDGKSYAVITLLPIYA